jgi:thioesterase domain-containing protein
VSVEAPLLAAGRGLLAAERRVFGSLPGRDQRLMRAVRAAAAEARCAWWAPPLPGRLLHLRSSLHVDTPERDGWWALATEGVTEIALEAGHVAMLREPDVAVTGAILQREIDAALERGRALALA